MNEPYPHASLTIQPAQRAYDSVLAQSGATLPRRDAVDRRVVEMVRTGQVTAKEIAAESAARAAKVGYAKQWVDELAEMVPRGFITQPSEVGGYPEYRGEPYVDTDSDGLPDEWESARGLNPRDANDASADRNGDGYTNIEEFINQPASERT